MNILSITFNSIFNIMNQSVTFHSFIGLLTITTIYNLVQLLVIMLIVLSLASLLTVLERKGLASSQRRIGPTYNGWYGLVQIVQDGLKLVYKDYNLNNNVNNKYIFISCIMNFIYSYFLFLFIYIDLILYLNISFILLIIIILLMVNHISVILCGFVINNSKWTMLSSVRLIILFIIYDIIYLNKVYMLCLYYMLHDYYNRTELILYLWFSFLYVLIINNVTSIILLISINYSIPNSIIISTHFNSISYLIKNLFVYSGNINNSSYIKTIFNLNINNSVINNIFISALIINKYQYHYHYYHSHVQFLITSLVYTYPSYFSSFLFSYISKYIVSSLFPPPHN